MYKSRWVFASLNWDWMKVFSRLLTFYVMVLHECKWNECRLGAQWRTHTHNVHRLTHAYTHIQLFRSKDAEKSKSCIAVKRYEVRLREWKNWIVPFPLFSIYYRALPHLYFENYHVFFFENYFKLRFKNIYFVRLNVTILNIITETCIYDLNVLIDKEKLETRRNIGRK